MSVVTRGWCGILLLGAAVGCGPSLPVNLGPNLKHAERIRAEIDTGGSAAAAAGPVLVEPTGWATLTGTIKLIGAPPAEEPLKVTQDLGTCAPGGKAPVAGTLQVAADGSLANVLLFLTTNTPTDDPKWEHESYTADKEATLNHPFDQKNCLFLERIFPARATQTIVVKNSDNVGHNANIQPKKGAKPENFTIPGGQAVNYKPGGVTDEPFAVSCSIHPWMKAWMISRPNPYFAVSDKSGTFKIENLPAAPGLKLEFRGWHERSGYIQKVTVDGQAVTWKKGRFELELEPGATKNLEITIDAAAFQ